MPAIGVRAIEQWTSRVYGRPTERVETTAKSPQDEYAEELRSLTHEQRRALMRNVKPG